MLSVRSSDGVRVLYLPRSVLPFSIPQIDSLPTVKGRAGSLQLLNFESVRTLGGQQRTLGVSCLVPGGFADNQLALQVVRGMASRAWPDVQSALLRAAIRPDLRLAAFPASTALRASLVRPTSLGAGNASFGSISSGLQQRASRLLLPPSGPCLDYFDGANPFRSDDKTQPLPPVIITGRPNPPYPFDLSEALRALGRRHYRIMDDGMMPSWFYDGPDCAVASEVYLAYEAAAQELEAEGAEMDYAANAVQSFVCEPVESVPGGDKTICIDFFIMSKTAFFIAEGDDRGFNVNARHTASRAHVYINPNTGAKHLMLNGSRIDFIPGDDGPIPIPFMNGIERPPMRHLPKDVVVQRDPATGVLLVRVELYNGFCTMAGRALCPSIDATIRIAPGSGGMFDVTFPQVDDYPSVQVNQSVNGAWTERARHAEHPGWFGPMFLINLRRKADILRQTGAMPNGCMVQ